MTGTQWLEQELIILLAGVTAERLCYADCSRAYRRRRRRNSDPELVAHHESGHVIAAKLAGRYPIHVTIVPDISTLVLKNDRVFCSMGNAIIAENPAAVVPKNGSSKPRQPRQTVADLQLVSDLLGLVGQRNLATLRRFRDATEALLRDHWHMVERLADALQARGSLDRPEIEAVLAGCGK